MKRFLVLALFCAGNLLNDFFQLTFSPIFASTQAVFGVSAAAVTLLPTLYLAAFAPAALALALLRARWGLRACILAGAGVQALGALLRYAACALAARAPARGAFALLAAGQLLAALAQPVFTNLPAVLSATWFAAAQRALATVFATIANPIGNALGSALPALVVPDVPPGASPAAAAAALARLTLAQFLAAALVAAAVWAWVEDEPAEPPSAAAALRRAARTNDTSLRAAAAARSAAAAADDAAAGDAGADDDAAAGAAAAAGDAAEAPTAALLAPAVARAATPAPGAWAALRRDYAALLRDANFVRLLVGFGVGLGIFNALLALLGQLLAPCGYAPSVAGLAGGAMLASGLFSAVGAGLALRATGFFVPALRVGIACAALGMVNFLLALRPGGAAALLAASAVLGAAAVPLLPLTLENAAELTFPIAEDSSASLLTSAGKLSGVVFVLVLQPLVGRGACATVLTPAAGVVAGAIGFSALALLSFRVDYRRAAAERGAEDAAAAARGAGEAAAAECGAGEAAAAERGAGGAAAA